MKFAYQISEYWYEYTCKAEHWKMLSITEAEAEICYAVKKACMHDVNISNDIEYIYIYLDIQLCSNLTSKCEAKIKNEAIAVYYELIK